MERDLGLFSHDLLLKYAIPERSIWLWLADNKWPYVEQSIFITGIRRSEVLGFASMQPQTKRTVVRKGRLTHRPNCRIAQFGLFGCRLHDPGQEISECRVSHIDGFQHLSRRFSWRFNNPSYAEYATSLDFGLHEARAWLVRLVRHHFNPFVAR